MIKNQKKKNIRVAKEIIPRAPKLPQILKGMRDVLPQDQLYWQWVERTIENLTRAYGFSRIDTPVLEAASLFEKGTGKTTDIVEKEMYEFVDKNGEKIALRPEFTPSLARAYIEHGMLNLTQPVKLYTTGAVFRRENPQTGRYRQHTQWGVESFGSNDPVIDAELILLSYSLYKDLGLSTIVDINSVGHSECRNNYKKELVSYYRNKKAKLCEDCKRRLQKNPLRLLDCKEESCRELRAQAPQIVDWLCTDCKDHFMKVIEYIDEAEIPYNLNPYLVRGLDYYTHTVFEWSTVGTGYENTNPIALGGGGRYDDLLELYSGKSTPGSGFGVGIERVILALKEAQINPPEEPKPFVYIAQLGEAARRKALKLMEDLRKADIPAISHLAKPSLKIQLELANKFGARYVIIIGQKELLEGTLLVRDMDGGIQESVPVEKIVSDIKRKMRA